MKCSLQWVRTTRLPRRLLYERGLQLLFNIIIICIIMFFYLNVMWYVGPTPTQCCILSVFKIQNHTRNKISQNILYIGCNDIIFFCWWFTFRVYFKIALKLVTCSVEMEREWNENIVSTWSVCILPGSYL